MNSTERTHTNAPGTPDTSATLGTPGTSATVAAPRTPASPALVPAASSTLPDNPAPAKTLGSGTYIGLSIAAVSAICLAFAGIYAAIVAIVYSSIGSFGDNPNQIVTHLTTSFSVSSWYFWVFAYIACRRSMRVGQTRKDAARTLYLHSLAVVPFQALFIVASNWLAIDIVTPNIDIFAASNTTLVAMSILRTMLSNMVLSACMYYIYMQARASFLAVAVTALTIFYATANVNGFGVFSTKVQLFLGLLDLLGACLLALMLISQHRDSGQVISRRRIGSH